MNKKILVLLIISVALNAFAMSLKDYMWFKVLNFIFALIVLFFAYRDYRKH